MTFLPWIKMDILAVGTHDAPAGQHVPPQLRAPPAYWPPWPQSCKHCSTQKPELESDGMMLFTACSQGLSRSRGVTAGSKHFFVTQLQIHSRLATPNLASVSAAPSSADDGDRTGAVAAVIAPGRDSGDGQGALPALTLPGR